MILGSLCESMVVETNDGSQQGFSTSCQSPASRSGDFGDQAADMQAFQQASYGVGTASSEVWVTDFAVQLVSDVGILEAAQVMVS